MVEKEIPEAEEPEIEEQETPAPQAPQPEPVGQDARIAEAVEAARRAAEAAAQWSAYTAQQSPYQRQPEVPDLTPPEGLDPDQAAFFEKLVEQKLGTYFNQFGSAYQRDRMTDYAYRDALEMERASSKFPAFRELEGDIRNMIKDVPIDQRAQPGFYQLAYEVALGRRVAAEIATRRAAPVQTGGNVVPMAQQGPTTEERAWLRDRFGVEGNEAELLSNRVFTYDEYKAAKAARSK